MPWATPAVMPWLTPWVAVVGPRIGLAAAVVVSGDDGGVGDAGGGGDNGGEGDVGGGDARIKMVDRPDLGGTPVGTRGATRETTSESVSPLRTAVTPEAQ